MFYSLGTSPETMRECPAHSHDVWEIVLNVRGEGLAVIGGIAYPYQEGTIMCIPPHTPHDKRSDTGFYDIYFHTDSVPLFRKETEACEAPVIAMDDSEHSFESLVRMMIQVNYQNIPNKRMIVNSLHDAALQLLAGWLETRQIDPLIEEIRNEIIHAFTDPEINLTSILSRTGYTDDYIRRRFKAETGMTPKDYLTGLRIGYAKQLMEQNTLLQLSISNIGIMCGYYDVHYFSRIFRKVTGMAPSEYLRLVESEKKIHVRLTR